jgi:hypothetical protein
MFSFTTPDEPSKVMQFYQEKAKDLSMKASVTANTSDGGMLVLADEDRKRSLSITVGKGSDGTNVAVTYGEKR